MYYILILMCILESVIVDAPDFEQCYERAYDKWVAYVTDKEQKGKEMVNFEKT